MRLLLLAVLFPSFPFHPFVSLPVHLPTHLLVRVTPFVGLHLLHVFRSFHLAT